MAKKETIIHVKIEGDAIKDTEKLSDNMKDVKKEGGEVTETFGIMQTGIGKMATGVIAFGKKAVMAFKTVKGAIISTGIGALVVVVISLIQYFTKTEAGAQKLRVIMAGLGQIVANITEFFIQLGKVIVNIFEKPSGDLKNGIDEVGDSTKNAEKELSYFEKRWKEVGERFQGFKDYIIANFNLLKTSAKVLGLQIKSVFTFDKGKKEKIQADLQDLGNEIIKLSGDVEAAYWKMHGGAEGLTAAAEALADRDNVLRVDTRKNLVKEAELNVDLALARSKMNDVELTTIERLKAVKAATEIQNEISDEKIRLAKEAYEITKAQNALASSGEKDLDKEYELKAALINLEAERANKQKLFIIKGSALRKQEIKRIEKEAEDEKKRIEKEIEDEEKRIEAEKERKLKYQDEIKALEDENYLESLDSDAEKREAAIELEQEQFEEDLQRRLDNGKITAAELLELQKQGDIKFANQRKKSGDEQLAKQAVLDQIEINNKNEVEQAKLDVVNQAINVLGNIFSENKDIQLALMMVGKIMAVAQIIQNTAIANAKAAAASPVTGGLPWTAINTVSAGISIAGVVASAAKAVQESNAVHSPKKELGGWLNGPSHATGGINVEAEGGEFIVNKRSMANPILAQSVINANQMGNAGITPLTEERVIELAAQVVKSIPVYNIESEYSGLQRKVNNRESPFTR